MALMGSYLATFLIFDEQKPMVLYAAYSILPFFDIEQYVSREKTTRAPSSDHNNS